MNYEKDYNEACRLIGQFQVEARHTIQEKEKEIDNLRIRNRELLDEAKDLSQALYDAHQHNRSSIQRGKQTRVKALEAIIREYLPDLDIDTTSNDEDSCALYTLHNCTPEEIQMLRDGNRLVAIKHYRDRIKTSLPVAMQAVRDAGAIHGMYF